MFLHAPGRKWLLVPIKGCCLFLLFLVFEGFAWCCCPDCPLIVDGLFLLVLGQGLSTCWACVRLCRIIVQCLGCLQGIVVLSLVGVWFGDFLFVWIFLGFACLDDADSAVDFVRVVAARSAVACEVARFATVVARRTLAGVVSAIASVSVVVSFSDCVQFYWHWSVIAFRVGLLVRSRRSSRC